MLNEGIDMFLDDVVLAGLIAVGGTVAFLGAVLYFIWQDARKDQSKQ